MAALDPKAEARCRASFARQPAMAGGGKRGDLDDDDAGPFAVALGGELELGPQVKHGNDRAAEIDDTFYMRRHPGYRRDRTEADNLPNVENRKSIGLVAKSECQIASFPGGRLDPG